MDLLINENITSLRERKNKGIWLCAPVIITGAILLSISYLTDIVYTGTPELGIGETTAFSKMLFGIGNLINKLISPLLAGGIALYIGGLPALSAGLIGGMLTGMGVTFAFSSGITEAITGIYGSILAGLIAGFTTKITEKILKLILKKQSNIITFLCPAVSLILTTLFVFIADTISMVINGLSSISLAGIGDFSKALLVILMSIMITADIGGPFYLAAYVYAVASIATDEPQIMAALTAAGIIPSLSIGLAAILFKDRFIKRERYYAMTGIFCGLCGISQVAIPFYATRLMKVIIPSVTGGVLSGSLSYLFGCKALSPAGGILSVAGSGTFFYFLLSIICGVLFSTAIMGYTLNTKEIPEQKEKPESVPQPQKVAI